MRIGMGEEYWFQIGPWRLGVLHIWRLFSHSTWSSEWMPIIAWFCGVELLV